MFQIFDNAMITAGLNDDPRPMISRLNNLLTKAMEKHWDCRLERPVWNILFCITINLAMDSAQLSTEMNAKWYNVEMLVEM